MPDGRVSAAAAENVVVGATVAVDLRVDEADRAADVVEIGADTAVLRAAIVLVTKRQISRVSSRAKSSDPLFARSQVPAGPNT